MIIKVNLTKDDNLIHIGDQPEVSVVLEGEAGELLPFFEKLLEVTNGAHNDAGTYEPLFTY